MVSDKQMRRIKGILKALPFLNVELRQIPAKTFYDVDYELLADEIVDIADDGVNDLMTIVHKDLRYENENREVVNRSRLRVDSRKWLLSKLIPKKYGDHIDVTSGGERIQPPAELRVVIDRVQNASDQQ